MLNPPEISIGTNGSTCGEHEVTRYTINLETKQIVSASFPTGPSQADEEFGRYYSHFDFPAINEEYRGKEVSFAVSYKVLTVTQIAPVFYFF